MKSTESLDVAGKSVDLSSATGETAASGDLPLAENKRRRLVRGAMALAPLVLTLRSGAAAASCTGAKTVSAVLDNDGKPPASVGAVSGDVCYKVSETATCPQDSARKLLNVPGGAPAGYTIGSNGKCGDLRNINVAILSSQAATSFIR